MSLLADFDHTLVVPGYFISEDSLCAALFDEELSTQVRCPKICFFGFVVSNCTSKTIGILLNRLKARGYPFR